MNIIRLRAEKNRLARLAHEHVTVHNREYVQLSFDLDADWTALERTVVLYQSPESVYHVLMPGTEVIVPAEVLASRGTLRVGLLGISGERRVTTDFVSVTVSDGVGDIGTLPPDPTPAVYDQIVTKLGDHASRIVVLEAGGGGTGTAHHPMLLERDLPDQHPIAAISGLQSALNTIETTPGPQGPMGPQGPQGAPGADGLTTSVNGIAQIGGNVDLTLDDMPDGAERKLATKADASALADHAADATDPHGPALTQTTIAVSKATVATTALANTGAAVTADFAAKGAHAFTANGNAAITVANLTAGQRGSISLYCDATLRTLSWVGVSKWLGGSPVLVANKLTVVTLFHDGVGVIGSWGGEG